MKHQFNQNQDIKVYRNEFYSGLLQLARKIFMF